MEEEIQWFYRSGKNPTSLKEEDVEWTFYEKNNMKIEEAYQRYLFLSDDEKNPDPIEIKKHSIYNLEDSNYVIDFIHNAQKHLDKERPIGRFLGNVIENKELDNTLAFNIYRWYIGSNDISPIIWAPFRIQDNDKINLAFKIFCLSKGSNIYEDDDFQIDFNEFSLIHKKESKKSKVTRKKECPKNITRIEYFNNNIKPKPTAITTITENTIQEVQKDNILNFKNIFSLKIMRNTKVKFYWKQTNTNDSIILRLYDGKNENCFNPTLERLMEEDFQEICELIKTEDVNEFEVIFKIKIPFQLLGRISKSSWYFKCDQEPGIDEFWEQFSKDENCDIETAYKKRFLLHNEEEIYYGLGLERKLVRFKSNEYYSLIKNEISIKKNIMRFNPKNTIPDEITRINVPKEVFDKTNSEIQKHLKRNKSGYHANKFGPKTFNELVREITKELKNESLFLLDIEMFNSYDMKFMQYINRFNFTDKIIKIYTEEGFVYRRVNKILRDKDYNSFYNIKYYYFSLLYSLKKVLSEKAQNQYLYRGLNLRPPELNDYYLKTLIVNDMILFDEFLSTTSDINIALKYAGSGLLFEIEVTEAAATRIANIERISEFSHEKEVLLTSGSILKFIGRSERKEKIPTSIKFSLLESNSKAFFNFTQNYSKNSINLSKVDLDFPTIQCLFDGANCISTIRKVILKINDSSFLYILARLIIASEYINFIKIEKKGEIKNLRKFNFNYKKPVYVELDNFQQKDYIIFMNEIFEQKANINYFKFEEIYQSAFEHLTNTLKNQNTLNYLEMYRISNIIGEGSFNNLSIVDNERFYNIGKIIKNCSNLKVLKLNVYDSNELNIIANSLKSNFSLNKIKIIYVGGYPNQRTISTKKINQDLSIRLINVNTKNFYYFLRGFLIKENKITELKLSNNNLYSSHLDILLNFLQDNVTLEYLELVKCHIFDKHFIDISKAIEKNCTLKRINYENNHLTNNINTIISDMIDNKGITLNLNYNITLDCANFIPDPNLESQHNKYFKCVKSFQGHVKGVISLIKTKDEKIVSGSEDMSIKIWDPNDDYNCIKTLLEHEDAVCSLMELKDGKIVSGSKDKTIRIWDPNDDYKCIKTLLGHTKAVFSLIKLSNGSIVSGSEDMSIKIWDPNDDYNCIKTLLEHEDAVCSLMELKDGKIVSGSKDKTIRIWDPNDDYKCIKTLLGQCDVVNYLIKLNDGRIVSGSNNKLLMWDPNKNYIVTDLPPPRNNPHEFDLINGLIKLSDEKILMAQYCGIYMWDPNDDYKSVNKLNILGQSFSFRSLMKLRDGRLVCGLSQNYTIKIWEAKYDFKSIKKLEEHGDSVTSLIILNDGKIVSGSHDNTIKIWDPKNDYKCIKTLKEHKDHVYSLIKLDYCKFVSGSKDNSIKIWDYKDNDYVCIRTLIGHSKGVYSLLKLSDGKIVSGSQDRLIKIWDPNNGDCIKTLSGHNYTIEYLIKENDGKFISAASYDKRIMIWDPRDDYTCIYDILATANTIRSMIKFRNGIIGAGTTNEIYRFNPIDEYKNSGTILACNNYKHVTSILNLSDNFIATGSEENTIKLHDFDNLNNGYNKIGIKTINLHEKTITSLMKLSNGNIVSSSLDKTIKILIN